MLNKRPNCEVGWQRLEPWAARSIAVAKPGFCYVTKQDESALQ